MVEAIPLLDPSIPANIMAVGNYVIQEVNKRLNDIAPNGPAGGDLTGTYPNPVVSYFNNGSSFGNAAGATLSDPNGYNRVLSLGGTAPGSFAGGNFPSAYDNYGAFQDSGYSPSSFSQPGQGVNQFTNDANYITGVSWNQIGGTQTDIGLSGFTNNAGFITGVDWNQIGGTQNNINVGGFTNDALYISSVNTGVGSNMSGVIYGNGSTLNGDSSFTTDGSGTVTVAATHQASNTWMLNSDGSASFSTSAITMGTSGLLTVPGTTGATYAVTNASSAPGTTNLVIPVSILVYGSTSRLLGNPAAWLLVNIAGTDYNIPAYS